MNIKKGDTVKIIAGNDNGKIGTVISVDPSNNKIVVQGQGITMAKHFVKPRNAQEKGGIVEKERPIDASNVMYVSKGEVTRIGYKLDGDKKVRYAKKTNEVID